MEEVRYPKHIDDTLALISQTDLALPFAYINEKIDISRYDLCDILDQLTEQNYIKQNKHEDKPRYEYSYESTLAGKSFSKSGGYAAKEEKLRLNRISLLLNSRIILFGTGMAGIYYLFEIVRIYIVPMFQYFCNCEFVWQK